jgi:uncharacterized membrane protein
MQRAMNSDWSALWKVVYFGFFGGPIQIGENGPQVWVLYSLVPWIGVMALGYAFGRVLTWGRRSRTMFCLAVGLGAVALFAWLRSGNYYGDPRPWTSPTGGPGAALPAWLSFLNTTKYPASLLFLLMTLGPILALFPLLERARGRIADWISVFGRVPFFFYILHLPLIHGLALLVSLVRTGAVDPWLFANHPMGMPPVPDGYVWNLPTLYLVWFVAVLLLYFPCHWFADLKSRRRSWWLSYL